MLKKWPEKRKTAFEIRQSLLNYEKMSHFHEFEKICLTKGHT